VPNPERIQPPLYYLTMAGALKLSNSTLQGFRYPEQNPYWAYGTSGLNYALHPLDPPPADRAIAVSLRFLRFFSLLITLPGIAFTYRAARALWWHGLMGKARPLTAKRHLLQEPAPSVGIAILAVTALVALWPQAVFNSAVVGNDGVASMFGALITWLVLARRPHEGRRKTMLGLLAALGAVITGAAVKLNLILLAAPIGLAVLLTASPILIATVLGVGAVALSGLLFVLQSSPAILIPLFRRGNAGQSFVETLLYRLSDSSTPQFVSQALRYGLDSSFGLFGWGNVALPQTLNTGYQVCLGLAVMGLLTVGGRVVLRRWDARTFGNRGQVLLLLTVVGAVISGAVVLASFYYSIHLVPGRYLLPALPAFAALLVIGWQALFLRPLRWAAVGALIIIDAFIPASVFGRAYGIPPAVDAAAISNQLSPAVALAPDIYLMGWGLPQRDVYVGDDFALDLFLRADAPVTVRYTYKVEVVGPDGQGYALLVTLPGAGNYLSTDWTPGRIFRDRVTLQVRSDYPAPGVGHFRLSVLPGPLVANAPPSAAKVFAEFGAIAVHTRTEPAAPIPADRAAVFREAMLLRGLRVTIPDPKQAMIQMVWEVRDRLPDGTYFIHVRCMDACPDPGGLLAAQKDSPPYAGAYPTSAWLPGEFVADTVVIDLPARMPAGRYPIRIGVYNTGDKVRWPIHYAVPAAAPDNTLIVGLLVVAPDGSRQFQATYPEP
jgi:hypothetical protein